MGIPFRRALIRGASIAVLAVATPAMATPVLPLAPVQIVATSGGPAVTHSVGVFDPDGGTYTMIVPAGLGPSHGTVTFDQLAGSFTYTPTLQSVAGADRFVIRVEDGKGWVRFRHVVVTLELSVEGDASGNAFVGGSGADLISGGAGPDDLSGEPAPGAVLAVERISKPSGGGAANGNSFDPTFTAEGAAVLFTSEADLLAGVAGTHVYRRDLASGVIELVSEGFDANDNLVPANGNSGEAAAAPDGAGVAFSSFADNIAGGGALVSDVFRRVGADIGLISVDGLVPGSANSGAPVFSPDGSYLAFTSSSGFGGLTPVGSSNIFLKSLLDGTLSVASSGAGGAADSPSGPDKASFSENGQLLVFASSATNLTATPGGAPLGFPGTVDVFLKDLATGGLSLVSTNKEGTPAAANSDQPVLSPDGTRVAFRSAADNLAGGETATTDIFVKHLGTGAVTLVSSAADGEPAVGDSDTPVFSPDGSLVAFVSDSVGLVPGSPASQQVYVKNLATGEIALVSRHPSGAPANGASFDPAFSPDGTRIAFTSMADNLDGGAPGKQDVFVVTLAPFAGGDDEISGGDDDDTIFGHNGNDVLNGDAGADVLDGGSGDDLLDGGANADEMAGGPGDDTYYVDDFSDEVSEMPGQGTDLMVLQTNLGPAVELPVGVENLTLDGSIPYGTGNGLDNTINGEAGPNVLDGRGGDDVLFGSGGDDQLFGGDGTDMAVYKEGPRRRYHVSESLDGFEVTDLVAGGGTDTLVGIEYLLIGGQPFDLAVAGNNQAPVAPEVFEVYVKQGATATVEIPVTDPDGDPLTVELVVPSPRVTLSAAGSAPGFTYTTDPNVKFLDGALLSVKDPWGGSTLVAVEVFIGETVTGTVDDNIVEGGPGDDSLSGGAGADLLTGGPGNDRLDGGPGADTMKGEAGNDIYVVDDPNDKVEEAPGGGHDKVEASVTFTLPAEVEDLTLTGTGHIGGTGNAGANKIIGNAGNNVLRGLGGDDEILGLAGNDVIEGGLGVDKLDGGPGVDVLSFAGSAAGVSASLANAVVVGDAVTGFESLAGSSFADTLTGNGGANVLTGRGGNDTLSGGGGADVLDGGAGADTLTGGTGRDVFRFSTAPSGKAVDRIRDFSARDDRIHIENAVFKGTGRGTPAKPGKLASFRFKVGAAASTPGHRIIHDRARGILRYDPDGSGPKKAVRIATLRKGLRLTADHFRVY